MSESIPKSSGPSLSGAGALDLDGAGEFLELSRKEMMVLLPEAMFELRGKSDLAHQSLEANDFQGLGRMAHTIKSVAASIGAHPVRLVAAELEQSALAGKEESCREVLSTLEEAVSDLQTAVDEL